MEISSDSDPAKLPCLSANGYLLRRFEFTDLPLVREAAADPYIPLVTTVPATYSETEGIEFIRRQWLRSANREGYSFAIARAPHGPAVGQAWVSLQNATEGRASIGYWIVRPARGQGAATQALHLISQWAAALPNIDRLELYIESWNTASCRAAEKAGYQREGLLRSWRVISGERKDMLLYSLLSRETAKST